MRSIRTRDLAGFGAENREFAVRAAGCLLQYVRDTQKAAVPHLVYGGARRCSAAATRRNLELDISLAGRADLAWFSITLQQRWAGGAATLDAYAHESRYGCPQGRKPLSTPAAIANSTRYCEL
jgi:DNA mismatch repair protein MutS